MTFSEDDRRSPLFLAALLARAEAALSTARAAFLVRDLDEYLLAVSLCQEILEEITRFMLRDPRGLKVFRNWQEDSEHGMTSPPDPPPVVAGDASADN